MDMIDFRHAARRWIGQSLLIAATLAVVPVLSATSVSAQSWRNLGTIAGFYVDGAPTGMFFRCAGPSLTVNFTGFDGKLPSRDYRVAVSVDGLARILKTRSYTLRGRSVLVHSDRLANLRPLIDDLRAGRSVEISTPAGRYTVPLNGSGAALNALVERCG